MVKIRWIITDTIEGVSIKEFNTEWNGIYGYFELSINNQVIGYCPDRELRLGEEEDENILYWLSELADGIIQLKNGKKYEIFLLCRNLTKIFLEKKDNLEISFINFKLNEIRWSEEVTMQEFYKEIVDSIEKFLLEIQRKNSDLLETNMVQELVNIKKTLDSDFILEFVTS